MPPIKDAAAEFLANKRVAVTGVSREAKGHGSNVVYQRLRQRGYEVFAVNPNADEVEGDPCYQDLRSIRGGVDAVVIGTSPRSPKGRCASAPSSGSGTCGCTAAPAREASPRRRPTTASGGFGRRRGTHERKDAEMSTLTITGIRSTSGEIPTLVRAEGSKITLEVHEDNAPESASLVRRFSFAAEDPAQLDWNPPAARQSVSPANK
jgi:CoA binding domain